MTKKRIQNFDGRILLHCFVESSLLTHCPKSCFNQQLSILFLFLKFISKKAQFEKDQNLSITAVNKNHHSTTFCSQTLLVLEILEYLFESCHLELSAVCHQLKGITNRMSQAPASNLASSCPEFRDHESDIRGELRDLRGPPRLRPDWPSYLWILTNGRARTRSLNLRQSLGDSVQEAA